MTTRARRLALALVSPLLSILACGDRASNGPPGDGPLGTTGAARSELIAQPELYTGDDLGNKQLVLTFDDGPGPDAVTGNLARWLAARPVPIKATFFVNGACIAPTTLPNNNSCGSPTPNATAVLAEIKAKGHTIGNHTTTHRDLAFEVPNAQRVREMSDTHALILPYLTWDRWFFRAPYGSWESGVLPSVFATISANTEMKKYVGPIYWAIGGTEDATHTPDWRCWQLGYSTRTCGDQYLAEIRAVKKGIVLMHDPYGDTTNHDLDAPTGNTVDMVMYIVGELDKEGGWSFKGLDQVPSIAAALPNCNAACATCAGPGANQCASCAAGKYPASGVCTACTTCPAGKYASTACSPTANTVCTACEASCVTCSGAGPSNCLTCAPGKHVAAGKCVDDACSSCAPGTYIATECSPTADTVCTECAANTFSRAPNARACEPCAAGTFSGPRSAECTTAKGPGQPGTSSGGTSNGGTADAAPPGTPSDASDGSAAGCSVSPLVTTHGGTGGTSLSRTFGGSALLAIFGLLLRRQRRASSETAS
jgi:peptidoglycan/xylan/chitin deacetylase (PgdA/CDA1 family)